jgi:hypothetical protein
MTVKKIPMVSAPWPPWCAARLAKGPRFRCRCRPNALPRSSPSWCSNCAPTPRLCRKGLGVEAGCGRPAPINSKKSRFTHARQAQAAMKGIALPTLGPGLYLEEKPTAPKNTICPGGNGTGLSPKHRGRCASIQKVLRVNAQRLPPPKILPITPRMAWRPTSREVKLGLGGGVDGLHGCWVSLWCRFNARASKVSSNSRYRPNHAGDFRKKRELVTS